MFRERAGLDNGTLLARLLSLLSLFRLLSPKRDVRHCDTVTLTLCHCDLAALWQAVTGIEAELCEEEGSSPPPFRGEKEKEKERELFKTMTIGLNPCRTAVESSMQVI